MNKEFKVLWGKKAGEIYEEVLLEGRTDLKNDYIIKMGKDKFKGYCDLRVLVITEGEKPNFIDCIEGKNE